MFLQLIRQAERYTALAERLEPESADVLFLKANIALQRGELESAISLFRESLRRQPKNPDAMIMLAVTYAYIGRPSLAPPLVEEAFGLDPLTPIFNAIRGFVTLAGGEFEEATPHYVRWRQLDAENPFARLCVMFGASKLLRHFES